MTERWAVAVGVSAVALIAAGLSAAAPSATGKLTVTVAGKGAVTSSPKGIACPKTCSKAFTKGTKVKLTAKAAAGSVFSRWSGACTGTKPTCALTLAGNKKAGALFTTAPQGQGFTPQTLAGTWAGTWENETFGSTGPASIVVTPIGTRSFTFTANFGGNVFGCSSPPPAGGTVTQGTGPNTWSATGFNVDTATPAGGRVRLAYVHATSSLSGTGTSGCRPEITWRMGQSPFTGNTFHGRIEILLNGNAFATSVVKLSRG